MDDTRRPGLVDALATTPGLVAGFAAGLTAVELRWKPTPDAFSFVEQACHLRDLEVEGYAVRIRRLLDEDAPALEGFDGARVAAERDYLAQGFDEALAEFRAARLENIRAVAALGDQQLARAGVFAGGERVTLLGVLEMMREHDADHVRQLSLLRDALTVARPAR